MISPVLPVHDADTIALDLGIFIARQSRHYRCSRDAVMAVIREALPSQPEAFSKPHAPAADTPATQAAGVTTDGGVSTSSLASPSVAPNSSAVRSSDEQARHDLVDGGTPLPEHVDVVVATSLPGAESAEDRAPIPPSKPSRQTKRQQVIDCHKDNPDWNSFQIAEHLGFGAAHVQVIAGQSGIKLPRAPRAAPENMRDRVLAVVAAHPDFSLRQVAAEAGCSLGTASKWAKEALAKPPEAEEPSSEPQAQPEPELPPLSKPSERLRPLPEDDVSDVLHKPRKAPSVRFYLRDKVTGHFVHQSLQPAPHGDGPMMTMDRKWAWYDTLERYRGAKKRWPQIAELRKEAVSK